MGSETEINLTNSRPIPLEAPWTIDTPPSHLGTEDAEVEEEENVLEVAKCLSKGLKTPLLRRFSFMAGWFRWEWNKSAVSNWGSVVWEWQSEWRGWSSCMAWGCGGESARWAQQDDWQHKILWKYFWLWGVLDLGYCFLTDVFTRIFSFAFMLKY